MGSIPVNNDYYPIVGIQAGLDPDQDNLLRKVPVRMEVDDWYQSQDISIINQRSLFFPAFMKFQQMDAHEKLSWYQIAGIHGQPFISWDEPPQSPVATDWQTFGYCTHNSILFSTWHRPYMMLWEQVIYHLMKKEAEKYSESDQPALLQAADSWRFPYWDWALKKPVAGNPTDDWDYNVPLVILDKEVEIRQPGIQTYGKYPNAFYQFTMYDNITMGDSSLGDDKHPLEDLRLHPSVLKDQSGRQATYPWNVLKATSRHPTGSGISQAWIDGKQNNDAIVKNIRDYRWGLDPKKVETFNNPQLGNLTASLREAFYRVLTIEKFEDFGTKRVPGHGSDHPLQQDFGFDSSEGLHDNLHMWCGGGSTQPDENMIKLMGHMSHVPAAAFDPIFWLHHCNIDRLLAIWQVLHDSAWFDTSDIRNQDEGNFYISPGHQDMPTDDLRPFRKDIQGNYWNSDNVSNTTALGYTYPGLERWHFLNSNGTYNKQAHIAELSKEMNQLYNASWSARQKSRLTADPGENGVGLMKLDALVQATGHEPVDLIGTDDYVVNVVYEKFALNGTQFTVHIFVGKVPDESPYTFQEPGSQVGQVNNFSTELPVDENEKGCENCRMQRADHDESTGRVVLTNALITRWKNEIVHESEDADGPRVLGGMAPEQVVEFLKHHLHWRVTSLGRLVELDQIPSLKVSLAAGKADHFADRTRMSKFHGYKAAYEVTEGRPGGATRSDGLYPMGFEYTLQE